MTLNGAQPVVWLDGVEKVFSSNANRTTAVQHVNLEATTGELLVCLGPSGSGKTTLLTLIAGLLRPTAGIVSLFGRRMESYSTRELQELRARRMGFVFQTFHLIDALTALENVMLVLQFAGETNRGARDRARAILARLHIEHLAQKYPPHLSQGEKQRVAVARALVNEPDLVLADEPTASLESKQGFEVIDLLHAYAAERHKCVIVASHDVRLEEFADVVVRLSDGQIVNIGRECVSGSIAE